MLKSKVGYSINKDNFTAGKETAELATKGLSNNKLGLVYTGAVNNVKEVVKGIKSVTNIPVIGCTSNGGVIVPDGYITSEDGFSSMMIFDDKDMEVGIACHEAGKDARAIGRKVAIEAVENAKTTRAPAYFYMVASPKEEEEYLMGIQDVIGRVPMFGGSAADNTVEGSWKIICGDKVFTDGVAVAFFYTDNEIVTSYTGSYKETENVGIITKVKDNRELVEINNTGALKQYAKWIGKKAEELKGQNLLVEAINKPLGIKDPLGNFTVVRHPMFGNDQGTKTTSDDTITLGNKVVENTAIIQLEATTDELVEAPVKTLKDVKTKLFATPAAYVLIHDGARRMDIGDRIEEVYKALSKEAGNVPFIVPFTFGEYGYDEHSSNLCGGLMLSFTAFGKN